MKMGARGARFLVVAVDADIPRLVQDQQIVIHLQYLQGEKLL
jgi:hypothetical protein